MDILKTLRRVPKRVSMPAIGVLGLVAALGLTSLGIVPSFLGQSVKATGGMASAQPGRASGDGGVNIYSIADFVNRSPGERGEVDVLKKGFVHSVATRGSSAGPAPTQRALGKIFDAEPPGVTEAPAASLAVLPVTGLDGLPLVPQQGSALGPIIGGGAPIFAVAPGGVIIPFPGAPPSGGGGGGDGGDGGGGGIIDGPITLPPAVPEPETWAMIIMGLFGIGLAMRRAARARANRWKQSAS